ncbi:hypothetical protein BDB01DRAFT_802461 [Pilobolus umbonatus]|nr:hypothetical protein BDB01DRAFT_802461 [Pilobolus umbonatus]
MNSKDYSLNDIMDVLISIREEVYTMKAFLNTHVAKLPQASPILVKHNAAVQPTASFEKEVDNYIAIFCDRVPRTVLPMGKSLRELYLSKGITKAPPAREKIMALLKDQRISNGQPRMKDAEAEEILSDLRCMARQVKSISRDDGVDKGNVFHSLNKRHQLYYALMLEQRAASNNIIIHHCKKQWAARALLACAYRSSYDSLVKKRRRGKKAEIVTSEENDGIRGSEGTKENLELVGNECNKLFRI